MADHPKRRVSLIVSARNAGNQPTQAHIAADTTAPISIFAAGAMIALSVFFVFQVHYGDAAIRPPYAGLIGNQCAATPDSGQIPTEYTCEGP
jgi:hypothetical protein